MSRGGPGPTLLRLSHTFHIPVMGTGFTIDTPLRVARLGISSVVSLVDDLLVERMHEHHARQAGEPFEPVPRGAEDARARRITAYLDFVDRQVSAQVARMRTEPLDGGSELARYFRLLPPCPLRDRFSEWSRTSDSVARDALGEQLRASVVPGAIDVNIMTKIDRSLDEHGTPRQPHDTDALAALRGFARSTVRSSIVFSAGMNARLYTYASTLPCFAPDAAGRFEKRIVLKVSDFRSAEVQGKMLAKRGLWISEYRIESGLNCGGHAFASDGRLLGPILDDFRERRAALADELYATWRKALAGAGRPVPESAPPVRVTVQGGIGTAREDALLRDLFGVDGTGWGTPFLLVPEATALDPATRRQLAGARAEDVVLSRSSPLGVPFWNLMTSASERARRERIAAGRPGSACPGGYLALATGLSSAPLCLAARGYQRRKLEEPGADADAITAKSCICHDLGGGALLSAGLDPDATPAVCPGPNIVHFRRTMSLDELVDHIYGRADVLGDTERPHMLARELELYVDHLDAEARAGDAKSVDKLRANLLDSVRFYLEHVAERVADPAAFRRDLARQVERIGRVPLALRPTAMTTTTAVSPSAQPPKSP